MAAKLSARSLLDQIGEDLDCHICLERLNDARVLRCQHSFCRNCLMNLAEGDRVIRCPTCRDINPLPLRGVDDLPKDFRVNSLVSLMEQREKDGNGEECDGCEEKTATIRCLDCSVLFCRQCANAHARGRYKGHTQMSLVEYRRKSTNRTNERPDEICQQHREQMLEQFCRSCQVATCRQCAIDGHSAPNHQLVPLNEALENIISRLEIREGKLKQRKKQIGRRKASMERMSEKLAAIHSSEKERISSVLDENRSRVREVMQGIIGKLEHDAKEKLDALDSEYITGSGVLQDQIKELKSAEVKVDTTMASGVDALRCKSAANLLKTEDALLSRMDEIIAMTDETRVENSGESGERQQREGALIRQRSKQRRGQTTPHRRGNITGVLTGVNFMRFVPDNSVENLERELNDREFTVGHLVHRTVSEHSYHQDTSSCNHQ